MNFFSAEKNFWQTSSGNFSAWFKKICATEFKFNGHYRFSLPKQKSIFCKKNEKFPLVKNFEKFYKSKNISQGKSK